MLLLEDRRFYTYIYLNPLKPGKFTYEGIDRSFLYEPFYVGKGKGNRLYDHLKCQGTNKHKINTIKKILKNNKKPIFIKLYQYLTEKEAFDLEKNYISIIGRCDLCMGSLTNLTDGGEGTTNMSPPIKIKNLEKRRKNNSLPTKEYLIKTFGIDYYNNRMSNSLFCKNNPGSLRKGKTYEEIYGEERAEEIIKIQKDSNKGEKNGMYGKNHSEKTRQQISKDRLEKGLAKGENNPRWKYIDEETVKQLFDMDYSFKKIMEEYNKIMNTNHGHSSIGRIYKKIKDSKNFTNN